ncbi:RNA polymerase factor sigma-54 [Oceanobacillus halotolerans]|uniref:RNA polymerase factor sigma-54 n=1 Tax=Oceanobacillus halotolerans TaxID=2663380 RepID=UPI0013DC726C|nr:RNA polymerase factor sigma-54 [Oceanobacillus halotolerans]
MDLMLQQNQTLNLVMTTQLKQAIELLQYSTYDLYQFLQEQELENPLIELKEKPFDMPYTVTRRSRQRDVSSHQDPIDFMPAKQLSIRDELMEQIRWLSIAKREKELIHYILLNLDDNGYLPISVGEIVEYKGMSMQEVEKGVQLVQQLEPIGIGARSLQECLLLQARHYYPDEQVTLSIIEAYLPLLANKKWHEIAKQLDVSLQDVKKANDLIQTLDPKPCDLRSNTRTDYYIPDVMIKDENGKFVVTLNDTYLPTIHIQRDYTHLLKEKGDIGKYMQEHYRKYQWLVNSVDKRRTTILKVTQAIIEKQQAFLHNGFADLKPMTLREIANEVELHESTVSRATMNKVIQTPVGTFDYRMLFTSKIATNYGDDLSQANVKHLLKRFVESENKKKPFSDQKIADFFKTEKGITISRRTVAKYRDELNIPPSSKRKEIEI